MNINQTEADIFKALGELQAEEETHKEPEDLIAEEAPLVEEEPLHTDTEELHEDVHEEDITNDDEEPEEELTGAKFRHKLKAEKEARQKAEREYAEMRERLARLEGRSEAEAKLAEASKPEPEIPDQELEPEKYAIWKANKLEEQVSQMKQDQAKLNAERQWEKYQSDYAKKNPNYENAKKYLLDHEAQKIKQQYSWATPQQIEQHLQQQEYILAGNAAKVGSDPAQYIEFLAFQSGFRSEDKANVAPTKKKPNLDKIKRNAKKNASLIGGSSAAQTGDALSSEQLLAMTGDDLLNPQKRKLFEENVLKLAARQQ